MKRNNPLNVKNNLAAPWLGSYGTDEGGHALFSQPKYGIRAALICFYKKWVNGKRTLSEIIPEWAPADDHQGGLEENPMNDPVAYLTAVCDWSGIGASECLCSPAESPLVWADIMRAMARYELGENCPWVYIFQGYADWLLTDWPNA